MLHKPEAKVILLATISLFIVTNVFAQHNAADTLSSQKLLSYPVSLFHKATESQSHLFNGPQYVDYRKQNRDGHQYFFHDEVATGKVLYDGVVYANVPMLYDVVRDEVVIEMNGFLKQKLVSEKISEFNLHNRYFRRVIAQDSTSLSTGFYDVLHNGNATDLLAKRRKVIEYVIEDNKELEKFISKDKFYIGKNKKFYLVNSKSSVLKVFSDKKKELKKFARANKLQFRKAREAAILALVQHYDSLTN
ncbi:hypothetical protein [Rufibacter roseus]|uniref:Uncharacterized protein n=1 Tax=Rufibacter roseus TaxID=1567108 RepID=A0ABW2DRX1_9BACT|nr:hypothetical protein [Rufibacter roseus]